MIGRLTLVAVLLFCAALPASAQTQTTAEISGIVTDSSNGVVARASVTAVGKGDRSSEKYRDQWRRLLFATAAASGHLYADRAGSGIPDRHARRHYPGD